MNIKLNNRVNFQNRHIGPDEEQIREMLETIGAENLDELISQTIPDAIRLKKPLDLPSSKSEYIFLAEFRKLAAKNKLFRSYIGLGYYNCITPNVILRNILENPGWYTAYTPYQAEIAQGRLEALINFQTMVTDLTGLDIANASLLDEGTAAAEAMGMLYLIRKAEKKNASTFFVAENCFPQTIEVIQSRAIPLGIKVITGKPQEFNYSDPEIFGALLQYPDSNGQITDFSSFIKKAHEHNVFVAMAADLLSLTLLTPPGEMGADVAVGSTQRLGVPVGFGGPHAAYFATKEEFKRQIPGRIIGASIDAQGKTAYRMALQTREQHIRREKATSNICTSQVLLAVIAGSYAVYHGPEGLKNIALRTHGMAKLLAKALEKLNYRQLNSSFFDTLAIEAGEKSATVKKRALEKGINLRYSGSTVYVSLDESTELTDIQDLIEIFAEAGSVNIDQMASDINLELEPALVRKSSYLTHPVFNSYHSEHEMLRYLKKLENKDLSLVHSMISLGSCTMKLNATSEMIPVTWPEFSSIHPFVPEDQRQGYKELFSHLEKWLSVITGFDGVSLQPNSGAQGELAGLLVVRAYHENRGEASRNIALIPSSAHGTNPASAVMAGYNVVVVKCDEKGNIDLADLDAKIDQHKEKIAVLMVTYPSTHGVFEEKIKEICDAAHKVGGQVYMDGANMNAQVGLTSPAEIGADVCHLNLHKTFCIPHGGGGPGMGPIAVASHLRPYLPGNPLVKTGGEKAVHAVSSAPWGSASILPISYAYISMMGAEGLKKATEIAILNANYLKSQLEKHFPVLYSGKFGRCAHEFIIDCRQFKLSAGIEVEDIAKRLMDYGFHAPTVSFPVPGTLMIEPTESESKEELDRFCAALIQIREEIREVEAGIADRENNVLKNAPHTALVVMSDKWDRPYTREKAAFPVKYISESKFWPTVSRIDSAYGDRNLMCSCIPVSEFAESEGESHLADTLSK